MEERSKGFSLRKNKGSRRPQISAPQQLFNPTVSSSSHGSSSSSQIGPLASDRPAKPGAPPPRDRPRPGNTSDFVKRRYSTRFNQLTDFGDGPPVPSLPAIPTQFAQQANGNVAQPPVQGISLDTKALKDSSLDAEKYVTSFLSRASDQEIADYKASLRKIKNRTSTDLQQNVYQNRTQFIKISKEAEKLRGEMRTLRSLMSELTGTLGQASVQASVDPPALGSRSTSDEDLAMRARKQGRRTSVANLEIMWNTQLQALWKNVEGSQKFLPAIPGRHIVHESGNWIELDAATWKPKRSSHLFLVNDHFMVATRKRKRVDPNNAPNSDAAKKAPTKLVAERCFPLQEVDLVDLASSNGSSSRANGNDRRDMSSAIALRYGHESFTFRVDRPGTSDKADLLLNFRKTSDELRKAVRADDEEITNKSKETMNYLVQRDPVVFQKQELLSSLSKSSKDRAEVLIDVDGKQKNFRWIEGQIDELDMEVAMQRFEDAVNDVERLRKLSQSLKNNAMAQDLITIKLDERAGKLSDLLTQRLIDTHSFLAATQTNVSWLTRLGFEDRAREAFLKARTGIIAKRARQCVFEGNVQQYISQISFVYFTLIRNTVSIYQQCFPPIMMSACVKWAKEHLDGFNVILMRQLSNVNRDGPIWQECLERAKEHAEMMDEVGLNFKDMVGVDAGAV